MKDELGQRSRHPLDDALRTCEDPPRATVAEVQAWLSRWPDAGIGIVTGSISRIVVLDIDFQHGGDASVERLEQQHGYMPVTVECRSGGGGRHLYFAHPGDLVRNKVGLAAGGGFRGGPCRLKK